MNAGPISQRLIEQISAESGILEDDVKLILSNTFRIMRHELARGGIVLIREFGKFSIRVRAPRKANCLGGKGSKKKKPPVMILPEKKMLKFRPHKHFEIEQ
jgi:nucleoid DNA-binding protein